MSNKITKAFSFFTGLTRGAGKPATAPAKTGTTRPASNAALQNLARLSASSSSAASVASAAVRPRLSARDLPRAGAAARARAQALMTAREVARIQALPSPALPLDVQKRFDALKASMPKPGSSGATGGLKPTVTGEKRNAGSPQPISIHVNVSLSAPAHAVSGNAPARGEKAGGNENAAEGTQAETVKVANPKAEAPKAEAPKAEAPKAQAPKAEAPKAEAPKAEEPKAEEPKAEEPKAEEPKAEEPKAEGPKAEGPKPEGAHDPAADARQEIAGLEGKVHDHVNAMHNAVAAHPAQPPYDLFQQEMAELQQLAILISQMLQRLVQHAGQALLSITRN